MRVSENELGEMYISGNGLHRYKLLRLHYLNELLPDGSNREELRKKYTIPVILRKTNHVLVSVGIFTIEV